MLNCESVTVILNVIVTPAVLWMLIKHCQCGWLYENRKFQSQFSKIHQHESLSPLLKSAEGKHCESRIVLLSQIHSWFQ